MDILKSITNGLYFGNLLKRCANYLQLPIAIFCDLIIYVCLNNISKRVSICCHSDIQCMPALYILILSRNVSNDMKMMSAYKDPNKVIFQYQVFFFFFF